MTSQPGQVWCNVFTGAPFSVASAQGVAVGFQAHLWKVIYLSSGRNTASGSGRVWCLAGPFPLCGLKPCDLGLTQTDERWLGIFCCHLTTVFLISLSALLAGKELWRPKMACVTNAGPKNPKCDSSNSCLPTVEKQHEVTQNPLVRCCCASANITGERLVLPRVTDRLIFNIAAHKIRSSVRPFLVRGFQAVPQDSWQVSFFFCVCVCSDESRNSPKATKTARSECAEICTVACQHLSEDLGWTVAFLLYVQFSFLKKRRHQPLKAGFFCSRIQSWKTSIFDQMLWHHD